MTQRWKRTRHTGNKLHKVKYKTDRKKTDRMQKVGMSLLKTAILNVMKISGAREETYRIEWKIEEKAKGDIDQSGRRARNESSYFNHYIELFQCFLVLYKVEEKKEYRRKWGKVCEMEHVIGEERGNKEEKRGCRKKGVGKRRRREERRRRWRVGVRTWKWSLWKWNTTQSLSQLSEQCKLQYSTTQYNTIRCHTIWHIKISNYFRFSSFLLLISVFTIQNKARTEIYWSFLKRNKVFNVKCRQLFLIVSISPHRTHIFS